MKRIALCLCGFEPATERSIPAASAVARVMPGVGDARGVVAGVKTRLFAAAMK